MKENNSTILVVDDTKTNIDLLLEILTEYDVVVATNGITAIEIANEDAINLILLDIRMPGIDGYEVCKRLKSEDETKDIPIIFITANADEQSVEKGFDSGGSDYITKPFKPKELLARIKTQLKLQLLIEDLNFLAYYDSMTGIYNRRKFFELAEKLFEKTDTLFAVMLDIDKFKAINDKYGHPVGDQVIKAITKAISGLIAENAIFGRLGGEEFAIIYSEHSIKQVQQDVENIRIAIEQLDIVTENNERIKCTISSGIAQKKPDTLNLDHLLKMADNALYQAKDSGRNKVVFFRA